MKRIIRYVLLLIFLAIFVISAYQVYTIQKEYQAGSDSYSSLEQYVSFEKPSSSAIEKENSFLSQTNPTAAEGETMPEETDDAAWPVIDFEALKEINPDVIGWIYIEGTQVNYPVVQGPDNSYYLDRLFDGTYNGAGSIFMDEDNTFDFSDRNSILYGHHMKNGSMFQNLSKYKKQEFYDEHPAGMLLTPTGNYEILFFTGYVASTSASAWDIEFTDATYEKWLSEIAEKSCFESDVIPAVEDRILTLSTCSYEFADARFVMHGILQE